MSADTDLQDPPRSDEDWVVNPTPDPIPVRVVFGKSPAGASEWRVLEVLPAWDDAQAHLEIRLFPDEAEGYYLNVTTDSPTIFVHWRKAEVPEPLLVTLSYNEAGRLLDGGETVDSLPMPAEMQAWLTEYVNLNYQPEQKKKKGGRNRPSFMKREEFGKMVEVEKGFGAKPVPFGAKPVPNTKPQEEGSS
jgi:Protein of unknown function (DUF3305)